MIMQCTSWPGCPVLYCGVTQSPFNALRAGPGVRGGVNAYQGLKRFVRFKIFVRSLGSAQYNMQFLYSRIRNSIDPENDSDINQVAKNFFCKLFTNTKLVFYASVSKY